MAIRLEIQQSGKTMCSRNDVQSNAMASSRRVHVEHGIAAG
jgi:hypothetical protein